MAGPFMKTSHNGCIGKVRCSIALSTSSAAEDVEVLGGGGSFGGVVRLEARTSLQGARVGRCGATADLRSPAAEVVVPTAVGLDGTEGIPGGRRGATGIGIGLLWV